MAEHLLLLPEHPSKGIATFFQRLFLVKHDKDFSQLNPGGESDGRFSISQCVYG